MMIRKPHIFVLLVVLVLFGMIVSPVSAYVEVFNYNGVNYGTAGGYYLLSMKNVAYGQYVTYIRYDGLAYTYAGARMSGTYSSTIKIGATVYGNYTCEFWSEGPGSYSNDFTMDIYILDFDKKSLTGLKDFVLTGLEAYMTNGVGSPTTKGEADIFNNMVSDLDGVAFSESSGFMTSGHYVAYTGSSVSVPVANFECDPVYTQIGDLTICMDTSTNTPTDWDWKVWYPGDDVDVDPEFGDSAFDTLGFEVNREGWYWINLTVSNSAGSDSVAFFGVKGIYSGNETEMNVTPIATVGLVPTGIANVINKTKLREDALNTSIGNFSAPFIDGVDYFADGVNATFTDIIGIFTTPLDWLELAVSTVFSDIVALVDPFFDTANIFLQMISRSLAILPAVFVNLVTLGLCVDVVRLILSDRGA
jgi:hypothetical protein